MYSFHYFVQTLELSLACLGLKSYFDCMNVSYCWSSGMSELGSAVLHKLKILPIKFSMLKTISHGEAHVDIS